MSEHYSCWKCGSILTELILPMSRRELCANCHAEQHVCKMCQYYRPQHSIFCDEERADPPAEVESANFCDYFVPTPMASVNLGASKTAAAKADLEALFGGEISGSEVPGQSNKDRALEELNKLFGEKPDK